MALTPGPNVVGGEFQHDWRVQWFTKAFAARISEQLQVEAEQPDSEAGRMTVEERQAYIDHRLEHYDANAAIISVDAALAMYAEKTAYAEVNAARERQKAPSESGAGNAE